jgi:hypothetical protein
MLLFRSINISTRYFVRERGTDTLVNCVPTALHQPATCSITTGLIINFIHHFWPSLLSVRGFLQEFITPIVKVRSAIFACHVFHSTPARGGSSQYWFDLCPVSVSVALKMEVGTVALCCSGCYCWYRGSFSGESAVWTV